MKFFVGVLTCCCRKKKTHKPVKHWLWTIHFKAVKKHSSNLSHQDGRSSTLTAPNGPSQTTVMRVALAEAKLQPEEVVPWQDFWFFSEIFLNKPSLRKENTSRVGIMDYKLYILILSWPNRFALIIDQLVCKERFLKPWSHHWHCMPCHHVISPVSRCTWNAMEQALLWATPSRLVVWNPSTAPGAKWRMLKGT